MDFLRNLFGKKQSDTNRPKQSTQSQPKKVDSLEVVTNITLQLKLTYPFHNEESIIEIVKETYGLDDATARAYFKETFEGLKKSGGLKD